MHHILTYLFSRQVCGCDGKNYNNECQAHSLGMSISSYGPCPTMSPTMSPTRIPTSKPVTKIPTSKPTKKIPTSKPTSKQAANKASVSGSGSSDDRSYHQDTNVKAANIETANIETPNYQGTNKASGTDVNYQTHGVCPSLSLSTGHPYPRWNVR
jgi:hypothetical protein